MFPGGISRPGECTAVYGITLSLPVETPRCPSAQKGEIQNKERFCEGKENWKQLQGKTINILTTE
jgi:hypothetical protein